MPLRRNAGGESLFEASDSKDLTVAALVEAQKLIQQRPSGTGTPGPNCLPWMVQARHSTWLSVIMGSDHEIQCGQTSGANAAIGLHRPSELKRIAKQHRKPSIHFANCMNLPAPLGGRPPWTKLLHNNSALRRAAEEARRSVDIFNRVQEYWLCVKLLSGGLFPLYHSL